MRSKKRAPLFVACAEPAAGGAPAWRAPRRRCLLGAAPAAAARAWTRSPPAAASSSSA